MKQATIKAKQATPRNLVPNNVGIRATHESLRQVVVHASGKKPTVSARPAPPSPSDRAAAAPVSKPETNAFQPKLAYYQADFIKNALQAKEANTIVVGKIDKAVNKGFLVNADGLIGLLPIGRLGKRMQDAANVEMSALVGQTVSVKVVQVELPTQDGQPPRIQLSQVAAIRQQVLSSIKEGDVVRCKVMSLEEFGVLVSLSGQPDVVGMLHKSELSWEPVLNLNSIASVGEVLDVKVVKVNPSAGQFFVSLKQLQQDPLSITLDTLDWEQAFTNATLLPETSKLLKALQQEEDVTDVQITRQAIERQHASQELEIYLTKDDIPGEFRLVSRVGSLLYELRIATPINRDQMRLTIQRVMAKIKL